MSEPVIGERIRYTTKTARTGTLRSETREGVVTCIWSNGWDGAHIDTDSGTCIQSLGDTWEHIQEPSR